MRSACAQLSSRKAAAELCSRGAQNAHSSNKFLKMSYLPNETNYFCKLPLLTNHCFEIK